MSLISQQGETTSLLTAPASSPVKTMLQLQPVLADLDGYRDTVARLPRAKDTRLFAALECLKEISNTTIGAKLLGNIKASGKQVVLYLDDVGGSTAHSKDLSIHFDPRTKKHYILIKDNRRQLGESSPAALLFHELVHINQFINAPTCYVHKHHYSAPETSLDAEYDNLQEWDVIHGRSQGDFSENAYRKEAGLPLRVTHRGISNSEARKIHAMTQEQTASPIEVNSENEEEVRTVLKAIVSYGLEAEARGLVKNYRLRFSDFQSLAESLPASDYFESSTGRYDGVRENILAFLLAALVKQKPSERDVPAKVYLKSLFQYRAYRHDDFQKKFCRYLPLSLILERTTIVQKAIREENVELLEFLVRKKGLSLDTALWHSKLKQSLTFNAYATRCKWDKEAISDLFSKK